MTLALGRAFGVLLLALGVGGAMARTATCPARSETQIAALIEGWVADLRSGDAKSLLARYGSKATITPDIGAKPLRKDKERRAYVESLLARRPNVTVERRHIELKCKSAVDAGVYTFNFADGSQTKAHYRFRYAWIGERFVIVDHEASVMPPTS